MSFNEGDKVWCISKPKGNRVSTYEVGKLYTLKAKSYAGKYGTGKFQGWLTEENTFWVINEKDMELYEEAGGQNER